ncbi:MAG: hypothetical protein ACK5IQ_07475, partial [Bacteroidales bacterium]
MRRIAERTVFEIVSRYLQGKLNNVIAHELGHGKFKLHHTFVKRYGGVLEEGTTDNLMDIVYIKTDSELAGIQKALSTGEEVLAIYESNIVYLVTTTEIVRLKRELSSFDIASQIAKDQAIAGARILVE